MSDLPWLAPEVGRSLHPVSPRGEALPLRVSEFHRKPWRLGLREWRDRARHGGEAGP